MPKSRDEMISEKAEVLVGAPNDFSSLIDLIGARGFRFDRRSQPRHARVSVEALSGFKRFPQWMWRNADVRDFIGGLREHNDEQVFEREMRLLRTRSLQSARVDRSGPSVLSNVDPEAAKRARHHYSCFEHFGKNIASYGYTAGFGMTPTCEKAVVKEFVGLRRKAMEYLQRDGKARQMPTSAGSKMLSSFGMRKNIIATCSGAKSILVR